MKAERIDANAIAESSNIQLKGNRFLKNKIEMQDGRMLMALEAGGCHEGFIIHTLLLRGLLYSSFTCGLEFSTVKKKERARQEKMNNTFRSKEIKQRILWNIAHQSELTASEAPGYLLKISIMGSQLRLTESESPRRAV